MYLFWILVILGIILVLATTEKDDWGNKVAGLLVIVLAAGFISSAVGVVFFPAKYTTIETTERTTEIISFKDNFRLSGGSMFVGISQDMYYYYYTQEPDGAISLNNIYVRRVKLYEDSPQGTGYILERWSRIEMQSQPTKWVFRITPPDQLIQREIHVPPGTVLRQFILDTE